MISVVIPFRDRIDLTVQAVESVLNQTCKGVEIILVDDGSKESLPDSIRRDVAYVWQEHAGPGAARNTGVLLATGDYIAFLDSDDLFAPEKLERQLDAMMTAGAAFSHTSYHRIGQRGEHIGTVPSGKFSGDVFPKIVATCPVAMPTVMARADLLKANPFPAFHVGEDCCLWIKLAASVPFLGIDEPLSSVRIGPDSAAFNQRKMAQGLTNIAAYCLGDEVLYQPEQVKQLLSGALRRL